MIYLLFFGSGLYSGLTNLRYSFNLPLCYLLGDGNYKIFEGYTFVLSGVYRSDYSSNVPATTTFGGMTPVKCACWVFSTNNGTGYLLTSQKIDLSKYSFITAIIQAYNTSYGSSSFVLRNSSSNVISVSLSNGINTVKIDVSDLTEGCYIGVEHNHTGGGNGAAAIILDIQLK